MKGRIIKYIQGGKFDIQHSTFWRFHIVNNKKIFNVWRFDLAKPFDILLFSFWCIQRVEIRYFFLASIKYDNFQRGGQNCVGLQYYPHPTSLQMTYPPPPPNRALLPATWSTLALSPLSWDSIHSRKIESSLSYGDFGQNQLTRIFRSALVSI